MSDDMKKIYKAYAETIEPSETYKAKLIQQMDEAQKPKKNRAFQYGILAAGVCLAVGASLFIYGGRQKTDTESLGTIWEMVSYGKGSDGYRIRKLPEEQGNESLDLSDAQWIPGMLAKKLRDTLLILEYDSDADFAHSQIADADMVDTLCQKIATAKEKQQNPDSMPLDAECVYYRALFCDGSVIQFCIVDGIELVIENGEEIYQMEIN